MKTYAAPLTLEELNILDAMLEVVSSGIPYQPLNSLLSNHAKLYEKICIVARYAREMERIQP